MANGGLDLPPIPPTLTADPIGEGMHVPYRAAAIDGRRYEPDGTITPWGGSKATDPRLPLEDHVRELKNYVQRHFDGVGVKTRADVLTQRFEVSIYHYNAESGERIHLGDVSLDDLRHRRFGVIGEGIRVALEDFGFITNESAALRRYDKLKRKSKTLYDELERIIKEMATIERHLVESEPGEGVKKNP